MNLDNVKPKDLLVAFHGQLTFRQWLGIQVMRIGFAVTRLAWWIATGRRRED